jgi:hypothetical protein
MTRDAIPHFGTVGALMDELQKLPRDMMLGVSVWGHTYLAKYHRHSHGPLQVAIREGYTGDKICLIWNSPGGEPSKRSNSYLGDY